MSRNKVILLIVGLVALYLLLPKTGVGGIIKANMIAIAPYVLLFIIIWLLVTINMLKRAMKKLNEEINDANALSVSKMMNITFDVKRFMGEGNLIDLYNRANIATNVSFHTKELLYNSMRRKRIKVPVPSSGKKDASASIKGKANPNKKKKRKNR